MKTMRKTLAILLVVLFVVTVTASAVSADIKAHEMKGIMHEKASDKSVGYKYVEMSSTQKAQSLALTAPLLFMYTHAEHLQKTTE